MEKQYVTMVVELPDDPIQRNALLGTLHGDAYFQGSRIVASCHGDAITENEIFERITNPATVKALRADVVQRHELGLAS